MNTESTHKDHPQWTSEKFCLNEVWNSCPEEYCEGCILRVESIIEKEERFKDF